MSFIPPADYSDRSSGIGYETALNFAHHSPERLILAVRNVKAGKEASDAISTATGGKVVPEVWTLDLASFASVRAFAERCNTDLSRLDVFVSD
jgi:retinol dehydrogenase-12